jgi:hypothetical protein
LGIPGILFRSGCAAYQTLWVKQLSQAVGVDVYAVTTGVAASFIGLAPGSFWFARISDRMGLIFFGSSAYIQGYLFEKEGDLTIPEMVFTWYNSYQKQLYKRTLKAIKVQVQSNPYLGVLASVRDSLKAGQAKMMMESGENKTLAAIRINPIGYKSF